MGRIAKKKASVKKKKNGRRDKWKQGRGMNKYIGPEIFPDNDGGQLFSLEEVEAKNAKEREVNDAGVELIKEAGFIPFPLFFDDVDGNPWEGQTWVHEDFIPSCSEGFYEKHGMDYNIYVPSYERAEGTKTIKMLREFGVDNWYLCIDPSQFETYAKHYPLHKLVIREIMFRDDRLVDLQSSIISPNSMHGHAGIVNFLLSFSRSMGERRYWTMDDDFINMAMKAHRGHPIVEPELDSFGNEKLDKDGNVIAKLDKNGEIIYKINKKTGKPLMDERGLLPDEIYNKDSFYRCSYLKEEHKFDFVRFMHNIEIYAKTLRNPGFVGLEKFGLVFSLPILWKPGTRVYSYYLTDNERQVTHKGQHNNDVITSLELSKYGLVNELFEGICYNSEATQAGGGQTEVYQKFGTLDKGKVLVRAQPNFAKISYNYSRVHHSCDYLSYNQQRRVGAIESDEPYYSYKI